MLCCKGLPKHFSKSTLCFCLLWGENCNSGLRHRWQKNNLSQIDYDPESPASFGGIDSIYRAVKNEGKYQIFRNKTRLWLQKQDTYTLHKPVRYRFRRNSVKVGAMDDEWEADLIIIDSLSQQNSGYKYVLTVIDVLSKYAWVEAIKAKTGIW